MIIINLDIEVIVNDFNISLKTFKLKLIKIDAFIMRWEVSINKLVEDDDFITKWNVLINDTNIIEMNNDVDWDIKLFKSTKITRTSTSNLNVFLNHNYELNLIIKWS